MEFAQKKSRLFHKQMEKLEAQKTCLCENNFPWSFSTV